MKILFRCIFNAALFLMLIVAMVLLLPGLFGIRPYVVYSGSMEPKIPTGAVVFTKEGAYSPETGDIITFHNEDTVVTHRVVKKEEGTFITKGDANNAEDAEPVLPQQVQGIWKGGRIGGAGNAVLFLSSTTGMLLFIVCPILLLIVWDIITRRKADKNEKARADALEAELKALRAAQGVAGENEHRS